MRSMSVLLVGMALLVAACSSGGEAETESLSVADVTSTVATTSDEAGVTTTSAGAATSVTASPADDSASNDVSVDQQVVYESEFSADPGDEWDPATVTTSPSGEQFLGEFGDDRARLWLQGLPTHDEVTIAFDLYIIRSWDGLADSGSWHMELDDQEVISTDFSNDEKRQTWPDNHPFGDNPGGSGAAATDSLGYWYGEESNLADSTYHVERTFGHEGPILWLDFLGRDLQGIEDESWGIDNVVVTISRTPLGVSRPDTEVSISVSPGSLSVSGAVPDPTIETIIRDAAESWYGSSTLDVDLGPVSGSIVPTWLPGLVDVLYDLQDAQDLTLVAGLHTATLTGSLSTDRYRAELVDRLTDDLGYPVALIDETTDSVPPAVVDEVESLVALFDSGSSELDDEATAVLDRVFSLLTENPEMGVYVVGHTDLTGTEQANDDLSWDRAGAAMDYLVGRGISQDRLSSYGDGSSDPAVEGTADDANTANRRVVFWVFDR